MCSRCLRQCTKTENEQPEVNELWALLCAAYKQYQSEIVNGKKLYHRFVNDFVSYHLPFFSDDEHSIRMHIRNISSIHEILTERFDLIEKYFDKASFVYDDCMIMLKEFNTVEKVYNYNKQMGWFNDVQILLLVKYINDEELFDHHINKSELKGLFACSLEKPLIVTNMTWFLLLLNALYHHKFLVRGWQMLIAENQLLKSNKSKKPISKSSISSNISRKKRNSQKIELEPFKELIFKLKEYVE